MFCAMIAQSIEQDNKLSACIGLKCLHTVPEKRSETLVA